jgi:GT2 family glycosyltransferase
MGTVRVQAVLYRHAPAVVTRWLRGVAATIVHARRHGLVGAAQVALGDCSPEPVGTAGHEQEWRARLRESGIDLELVRFGANLGHAGGQNALAAAGDAELLLILNPDGVAATTMLAELLRALGEGVGAVEARQSPFEHPKEYDPATGGTSWVTGAAVLLRTEAFRAVDGFDADTFFLHGDDVDLSWRLRLSGWRLRHVPEAVFFHDKRLDAGGGVLAPETEVYHATLGALSLLHKYDRPDAVGHWEHELGENGTEPQRRALAEFRRKRAAGKLPEPVDAQHAVSEVIGAAGGPYRF